MKTRIVFPALVFLSLMSGLSAWATDMNWLQPGVRVWYTGGLTGGSDAEEAYTIDSIVNGAASLRHHSAVANWTSPMAVAHPVNPNAVSEGEFWMAPDRLRSLQAPNPVTWNGLACVVKYHGYYTTNTIPFASWLPIQALFTISPQRDFVVLDSQDASGEYYFDVDTGLLVSKTIGQPGIGVMETLAEINYDFYTHQAFAEDRGPHSAYKLVYSGSRSLGFALGSQSLQITPIVASRYGTWILFRHLGQFYDTNLTIWPFDVWGLYDSASEKAS